MTSLNEPLTPEHDKFRPHQEDANTIGEFLEWLSYQGIHRMKWGTTWWMENCPDSPEEKIFDKGELCIDGVVWRVNYFTGEPKEILLDSCLKCNGTGEIRREQEGWIDDKRSIQELIAEFFGIDKKKFDAETEAVYQYVAAQVNGK